MADRPSPYKPWYGGLPVDPSTYVSDKTFNERAKKKREAADKSMGDSLSRLHADIELAIAQQNAQREANPYEQAVDAAIQAAVDRDHIPSKRDRYLAQLGWREDENGGVRRIKKQKAEPEADALGITWPQLLGQDDDPDEDYGSY